MTIKLKKPSGEVHDTGECITDLNILGHAQLIELEIGSRCGGHGVCGGDRIRIADPAIRASFSEVTAEEREHLSDTEIADGYRLACQCYPDKIMDCVIYF